MYIAGSNSAEEHENNLKWEQVNIKHCYDLYKKSSLTPFRNIPQKQTVAIWILHSIFS